MEHKVGIITINWNRYDLTVQCVESLRRQRYATFHIYVVDNCSDQAEGQRLTEHYRGEPRITVILNPRNEGYAGGNNVGIRQARADGYDQGIWCINNDATAESGALAALVAAATADQTLGLIGSTILYPDRQTVYALGGATFNPWTGIDHLSGSRSTTKTQPRPAPDLKYISGAALYLTLPGLLAGQGFDPEYFLYCEELDLALRIQRAGLRLAFVPEAMVIHAFAASTGHMSPTYVYYFLRNRLLLLRKRIPWYCWPTYLSVYVLYYLLGFIGLIAKKRKFGLWRYISKAISDFLRHRWGYQSLP